MTATAAPFTPSVLAPPMKRETHYPQLDGLRCVAVLLVIWSHAGPAWAATFGPWGVGVYGVWLFFVLSAFLITGILLRLRGARLGHALRIFYARRVLRILPPYYAVIGIALLCGLPIGPRPLLAHLLYLSNTNLASEGPRVLGHFWSLSVEEQFYLTWPLLVLLVPRRRLPWLFVGTAMLAPIIRVTVALAGGPLYAVQARTVANLDCLGAGALLAWHLATAPEETAVRTSALRASLMAGLTLLGTAVAVALAGLRFPVVDALQGTGAALVGVWVVARYTRGSADVVGRLLAWRPVAYVGSISYTIYLVQTPVRWLYGMLLDRRTGSVALFLVVALTSIALAACSWHFFEGPINRRKARFPYPAPG